MGLSATTWIVDAFYPWKIIDKKLMYDICGPTRPPSLKLMIMNEIRWPFRAICLPSSKNGIMWPKANHGNMAMWSFLSSAMEFKRWCSVFFFTLLWLRYVGWTLHNDIRLLLWSFIAWWLHILMEVRTSNYLSTSFVKWLWIMKNLCPEIAQARTTYWRITFYGLQYKG